mmetsp:Transcript_5746/g.14874  ORF Transcript_5746/g.14874 Transcript_5746/m.14874 type:complete len:210 (+) Transcript_5746:81-710(+)
MQLNQLVSPSDDRRRGEHGDGVPGRRAEAVEVVEVDLGAAVEADVDAGDEGLIEFDVAGGEVVRVAGLHGGGRVGFDGFDVDEDLEAGAEEVVLDVVGVAPGFDVGVVDVVADAATAVVVFGRGFGRIVLFDGRRRFEGRIGGPETRGRVVAGAAEEAGLLGDVVERRMLLEVGQVVAAGMAALGDGVDAIAGREVEVRRIAVGSFDGR